MKGVKRMKKLIAVAVAAVAGTVFGATHNVPADGDLETVVAAVYDCKGLLLLVK